jgi:hypothetical protein
LVSRYQVQRCQGSRCSEFSTIGSAIPGLPLALLTVPGLGLDATDNRGAFSKLATAATLAAPAKP